MANTPPAPKRPSGVFVPLPKKHRDEEIEWIEQDRNTEVDLPHGDEIAVLLACPARTFRAKEVILDIETLLGYYVILSGTAEETAVSSKGEPDADPIMLGSKDVIGINRDVRVVAQTDVHVAIVMLADLAQENPLLHRRAMEILFEAAMKNSAALRARLVLTQEELKIQRDAFEAVERLRQEERRTFLNERDEKIIDNTRLARRIKTLDRELSERVKELTSQMTILQLYRDQIEETEEIVTQRTEQLNELRERFRRLAALAPMFERMITSGKPAWTKVGQDGLTLLYTFGARLKSDPTKNPSHG